MTVVALLSQSSNLAFLGPMLQAVDPSLSVVTWPDPGYTEAEVAVCWDVPPGVYQHMPKLRLVHSIAAGVDNVVRDLPADLAPVCRVIDPKLSQGMLQFVLWGVLHFHRRLDEVLINQRARQWKRPPQLPASACRVGVMGLGELGAGIASHLSTLDYAVSGWSRTPRELPGVALFTGEAGYAAFLAQTDILVCLLPLTPQTRGILGARTFAQLPRGAALVHCGRGQHLVEADLLDALATGQLRGAVIDVFEQEPLPADHSLWTAPGVVVTPHMASSATYDVVAQQVVHNIGRLLRAEPLANQVNMARGY